MEKKDFDIYESFKGLKINEKKDINILLLGETGIGKSTFINSVANYLSYRDLKKAQKHNLMILIPAQINVLDKNGIGHEIKLTKEKDENETLEAGVSATQDVKTYVFPIGSDGATKLRFIDTPGIGDTRGPHQDNINCENILSYIGELQEIHAICFMFNSNSSRVTVFFEYCFKEILSRLDKSAIRNIVFIFTKSRGANFTPGETLACLRKIVDGIKQSTKVEIPLNPKNMFCFENDAFRYLAATKNGVEYEESVKEMYSKSWTTSTQECWRFISYIVGDDNNAGLKPHPIKNTVSINEARRLIVNLSQPLADITQYIDDNIRVLQRHKQYLQSENLSLDELRKKLYMPVINLKVTNLTQPVTICASSMCAKIYVVESVKKWHYKQRCHDPCYLTNVPKEIIGAPELVNCAAIDRATNKCRQCTCDYSSHMHVYYMTDTVNESVVDKNIQKNISNKQQALTHAQKIIDEMQEKKEKYERERKVIIQYTAQFAHFLQHNAITPFNDSYEKYIEYLIKTEESYGCGDLETINSLKRLLKEYKEIKDALNHALSLQQRLGSLDVVQAVTAQTVLSNSSELYKLPLTGQKIKEMMKSQKTSRSKEHDKNSEYTHWQFGKHFTKKTKNKDDEGKDKKSKNKDKEDDKKQGKTKGDSKKQDKNKDSKNKPDTGNRRDQSSHGGRSEQRPPQRNYPSQPYYDQPPPYSAVNSPMPDPYYSQPPHTGHTPYYQDNAGYRPNNPPQASHRPPPDPRIEVKIVTDSSDRGQSSSYPQEQPQHNYPQQQGYGPNSPYYIPPHTNQPSNYPPNYPSHGPPNYPPHGQPNYPPHGQPNYPQHGPPNYPQHGPSGYGNYGPNYGPQGKYYGPNQPRGGRGNYQGPYRSDRGGRGTSYTRPRPNKFKNERKKPKGSKKSNKSSDSDDSSSSGN